MTKKISLMIIVKLKKGGMKSIQTKLANRSKN